MKEAAECVIEVARANTTEVIEHIDALVRHELALHQMEHLGNASAVAGGQDRRGVELPPLRAQRLIGSHVEGIVPVRLCIHGIAAASADSYEVACADWLPMLRQLS